MKILLQESLGNIPKIHEEIFGEAFPYEKYEKKRFRNDVYLYGYYDDVLVGYTIVVDQKDKDDLYAWYGGTLPKYQGSKTTEQMFDTLVEKAKTLGRKSISVVITNEHPNMIRFAVKYGFEIVDLKKNFLESENKIYFKFTVHEPTEITISLNEIRGKIKMAELEKILVNAYRTNCTRVNLVNVRDAEDMQTVSFVISYCKGLLRKMDVKISI